MSGKSQERSVDAVSGARASNFADEHPGEVPSGHHRHLSIKAAIKSSTSSWATSGVDENVLSKNVFDILNIHRRKSNDRGETFCDIVDNYYFTEPAKYYGAGFGRFVRQLRSVMPLDLEEVYDSPLDCPILPITLASPDAEDYHDYMQQRKSIFLKIACNLSKLQTVLDEGIIAPELIGYYEAAVDFLVQLQELFSRQPQNMRDATKKVEIQELFAAFCRMANVKLRIGKADERRMNVLGVSVKSDPDLRILSPCYEDKFRWASEKKQRPDGPVRCYKRKVNAVIKLKPKVTGTVNSKEREDGLKFIEKDVGGQLLGEMLLDLYESSTNLAASENKERILGILVQCTKIVFVELKMPSDHYHAIRENDEANLSHGLMTVSKVYDMVKCDDRIPLLNMLNKISRIVA